MNRKDTINFAPQGINNKKKFPVTIVLIVIAALLFGAASFTVILAKNDFDVHKALGMRKSGNEEETEGEEETQTLPALTDEESDGEVSFLVVCAEKKTVDFCQVITVYPVSNRIQIRPVAPYMKLETEGGSKSVTEIYGSGSAAAIADALGRSAVKVDRYAVIDEDNFVSLIQKLGAVDMVLEKDFSFAGDELKYTFDAGRISMNADALLQYMKFASRGDELLRLQSEASAAILRTHFNAANASRGEEFFSEIINLVKTDISAFDYTAAVSAIMNMTAGRTVIEVVT